MNFIVGSGFDASDIDKSMLIGEAIAFHRKRNSYKQCALKVHSRYYRERAAKDGEELFNQLKALATIIRKHAEASA